MVLFIELGATNFIVKGVIRYIDRNPVLSGCQQESRWCNHWFVLSAVDGGIVSGQAGGSTEM